MSEPTTGPGWDAAHAVEVSRRTFTEDENGEPGEFDLVTYAVGVAVKGTPTFVLEVPTTQGPAVAAKRARLFGALQVDNPLDEVTTCDPGPIPEPGDPF